MVEWDHLEALLGDLLAAGEDRVESGAADQVRERADHAAGAVVEVAVQAGEAAGLVRVEPEGVLQGGDQSLPFAVVGQRGGGDQGEASGDLLSAGSGEQVAFDVDPGIDERRGDALGEVLQRVGDLGAGPGRQRDVVQFVDFTDRRNSETDSELRRFTDYMSVTAGEGYCCSSFECSRPAVRPGRWTNRGTRTLVSV